MVLESTSGSSVSGAGIFVAEELLKEEGLSRRGWATFAVLVFIFIWQCSRRWLFLFITHIRLVFTTNPSPSSASTTDPYFPHKPTPRAGRFSSPGLGSSDIVSKDDLKNLIDNLDEKGDEVWENVIEKGNTHMTYKAKCSNPKDGPLRYMSLAVFENCTPEILRDFYMDNDFRKQWDKTLINHEQLFVDETNGIEIGRTIKKFPLLTPREYVLAWKVWEGRDNTFYCFIKDCEHPLAPRQKKYVRVGIFRSGWRIRKVPGTTACEIKMVHQEDAGLNVEIAKLVFAKGIWSYMCKMENALRKYSLGLSLSRPTSDLSAVALMEKVPLELESVDAETPGTFNRQAMTEEIIMPKEARRNSKKLIANSLIILGGLICLTHGHRNLGAKVAVAYIWKKLSSKQSSLSSGRMK